MDDQQADLQTLASSGAVSLHRGFPNPALDRAVEGSRGTKLALDLNKLFIAHPSSTYLFRIAGHDDESYGLFDGDIAVIDRSLRPRATDLVLGWQPAGFIICPYSRITRHDVVWGVITTTIHQRRKPA